MIVYPAKETLFYLLMLLSIHRYMLQIKNGYIHYCFQHTHNSTNNISLESRSKNMTTSCDELTPYVGLLQVDIEVPSHYTLEYFYYFYYLCNSVSSALSDKTFIFEATELILHSGALSWGIITFGS